MTIPESAVPPSAVPPSAVPPSAVPLRTELADGRDILFFSLPGHTAHPVPDLRPLPPADGQAHSEIRYDRQTGDWVAVAALRQDRTYKPPADRCPLCPSPAGNSSEVPAADYDVVVFENRFPSLSHAELSPGGLPSDLMDGTTAAPGYGRCEVVCFSSNHDTSFAGLTHQHARLVFDAWRQRTAELMALPGVAQVFCFENRGEEIGVTLTHPHGQIYGYPYPTPRTAAMLRQAAVFAETHGGANLFSDILSRELADAVRVVAQTENVTAFVPFAARWPIEVHIYPNRQVHNLTELTEVELDELTTVYLDVLGRFDRLYPTQLPYISALHQYSDDPVQSQGYFHIELMSVRRSANKLKFLAGSESAMDAFITDVTPEQMAALVNSVTE